MDAEPRTRPPRRTTTAACILTSALGYALSAGVANLWPLAWIAPLPILWLALRVRPRQAALAAFLAYGLGRVGDLPILIAIVPLPVVAGIVLAGAAAFAAMIVLSRAVALRLDLRLYAVAFPLFWTAWEQMVVRPIGAGAEIGFSQADFLPLIQLASLTGVVGVTFIVTLVPAVTATTLALRECGRAWHGIAFGGGAVVIAVLVFGTLRVTRAASMEPVRVGVAVSDQMVGRFRTERADEALEVVDAYVRRTRHLASRGAEVVVLPEKLVGVTPAYADDVEQRFANVSATSGVWLVAGLNRIGLQRPRNVAVVFAPDGRKVLEYDKVHLVPGFEDAYAPGEALGGVPNAPGAWAVAVCRDLIVPELGPRLSRAGARLVFAPAWDFVADGLLESRVARVRAIEGGFALVRAAKQGVVTVADGYGRAHLAAPTSGTDEVLDVVSVAPGPGATLYARSGDWFGRACVVGALLLLVLCARRSRG